MSEDAFSLITVSVSINGHKLPINPENITFTTTDRQNSEFVTSDTGGEARTVSVNGGNLSVKDTVSFDLVQYPKSPHYDAAGNQTDYNSFDFIGLLYDAKQTHEPIELEVVSTIPRVSTVPLGKLDTSQAGRTTILTRHKETYQVTDLQRGIAGTSAFLQTARVTLLKHTPVTHTLGRIRADYTKGDFIMTFVDSAKAAAEAKDAVYLEYTNSSALKWIYDLLAESAPDGDNPMDTYPPSLFLSGYYLGAAYPIGADTHIDYGAASAGTPELQATETWGEMTMRYARNAQNAVFAVTSAIDTGVRSVLEGIDTGIQTVMSTIHPFISTTARIAAGVMTGGWSELARYTLMNYPWAGSLASNIRQEYARTQNILTSIGEGIKYSTVPAWLIDMPESAGGENSGYEFKQGLGYDPEKHIPFFKEVPTPQLPFEPGQKIPERPPKLE